MKKISKFAKIFVEVRGSQIPTAQCHCVIARCWWGVRPQGNPLPHQKIKIDAYRDRGVAGRHKQPQRSGEKEGKISQTHLLELFDRTLVNTTALVDQVCYDCEFRARKSDGGVRLRPVVVDLPESTWPMTTTLM